MSLNHLSYQLPVNVGFPDKTTHVRRIGVDLSAGLDTSDQVLLVSTFI